jgi:hypothetical protein
MVCFLLRDWCSQIFLPFHTVVGGGHNPFFGLNSNPKTGWFDAGAIGCFPPAASADQPGSPMAKEFTGNIVKWENLAYVSQGSATQALDLPRSGYTLYPRASALGYA